MDIQNHIIHEMPPLSEKDCFYVVDRYKTEFTYPMHSHAEYELNFIEHATGVKRIIGDSSEIIGEYDLVLITGKDLEHVWEQNTCNSHLIREITIQFSADLLSKSVLISKNQFSSIRKMLEAAQCGISFPMNAILKVFHLLEKLTKEEQGFYSVVNFLSILYELSLVKDYKILASSSFAKINTQSESRRIQKVQKLINDGYQQNLRLEQLAQIVNMTPTAFSRFFKLRTGKTVSDYITDIRIGHASRMLVDTQQSIAEICYDCGFNNLSNFNRIFKKKKECSPKEFRDNYKKTKIII